MFDNVYNSINLPRPYFEVKVGIDYLIDTFHFFHFDANLSSTCGFLINSTSQKKWFWSLNNKEKIDCHILKSAIFELLFNMWIKKFLLSWLLQLILLTILSS